MPHRLKLIVAYDGAPFAGWQSQVSGETIQDRIEEALARIAKKKLRVHGAGRTDAGVHALAQCAHVDVPQRNMTADQWTAALNAALPGSIRVMRCRYVSSSFHARFSAKGKTYRYRIWNDAILPPLEVGRAWHVPAPLDCDAMAAAAQAFVGKHDFAPFAASRGKSAKRTDSSDGEPEENTVRTVHSARLSRRGKCIILEFSGDGFLYKMVRLMVGALVQCGRGSVPRGAIEQRLARPAEPSELKRIVAPAGGLFLVRVGY